MPAVAFGGALPHARLAQATKLYESHKVMPFIRAIHHRNIQALTKHPRGDEFFHRNLERGYEVFRQRKPGR